MNLYQCFNSISFSQNILALSPVSTDDGNNYYEQYNIVGNGVIKSGDFVYVATDTGKQSIAQVQSIWDTKDGKSYIKGPWLLLPPEVPGAANRFFYRQELMLSTTQDISPTIAVVGRCSVLEYNEYVSSEFKRSSKLMKYFFFLNN